MDLSTTFMGLSLKNPIIVGSSSLTGNIDNLRKCQESGAGAVILKSLYEEQIIADSEKLVNQEEMYLWYPEAIDYVSKISTEEGVSKYLELIKRSKQELDIPVIASVNCVSHDEWPHFACDLENAGADGLELNITIFPFNSLATSEMLEIEHLKIVKSVREKVNIPIAVKMSYYFSNIRSISMQICEAGADALVYFNRFYRPDIDIYNLKMINADILTAPGEMTMPLRWVGLMSQRLDKDLSATTGIYDSESIIKFLLAGARTVQVCSVLYKKGIGYVSELLGGLTEYMEKMNFDNVDDFRGLINKDTRNCALWERINYMNKTTDNAIIPIKNM